MGRIEIEDGRLSETMNAQAVVFKCPICSTLLTRPLLPLSANQKICLDDGKDAVPEGRFATSSGDYWTTLEVTPHVAQNLGRRGGSAIDSRTTPAGRLCHQSEEEEAHRRMFWLAEDHCVVA